MARAETGQGKRDEGRRLHELPSSKDYRPTPQTMLALESHQINPGFGREAVYRKIIDHLPSEMQQGEKAQPLLVLKTSSGSGFSSPAFLHLSAFQVSLFLHASPLQLVPTNASHSTPNTTDCHPRWRVNPGS